MSSTSDMDSADFITLANQIANAPAEVDDNFSQVITDFNDAFDTNAGHSHDDIDSRKLGGGAFSATELMRFQMMGFFT